MQPRLKKLVLYRLILISMFLSMGLFFQLKGISIFWGPYTYYHAFTIFLYATTLIFALLFRAAKSLTLLIYLQIAVDAVIITAIVYVTGGGLSVFFPLYILAVLEAGVILERQVMRSIQLLMVFCLKTRALNGCYLEARMMQRSH